MNEPNNDELDRLDRLAAEKVMGWTEDAIGGLWQDKGHFLYEINTGGKDCWQPTRDIAQAWLLLKRVMGDDGCMVINGNGDWQAYVEGSDPDDPAIGDVANCATPELAIVLAALMAVGGSP